MSPEDQLEDLQRRFLLLEGERKANFETAEINQKQNTQIINQMTVENKDLRAQIRALRNEKTPSADKQLQEKMSEVQKLQRDVDTLVAENRKKTALLEDLDVKLGELSLDAKLHTTEASPEMRQIRVLENRLDKAMIKYNEAQSIRRTYEEIVKRLKQERTTFDNQLAAIDRTLKAKERDYEELLLLSHDAYHAKEMAQAELHRFEQGVMEERNQRDREVQEKKALVHQRVEMNQRLEQREKMLKKQEEMDKQGERQLKELSATSELHAGAANEFSHEESEKLKDYDDAMNRIKDATGVNDVNEVIQKFLTQEDTRKNLKQLTTDNQAKIDRLNEDRRRLKLEVDDLKFSSGGTGKGRQAIDTYEHQLTEASEKLERNKQKYERMAKMLIDMKSGIGHLAEKLLPIKLEGEAPIEMSDDSVEEVLQQCELKLSTLINQTHHLDDPNERRRMLNDTQYEEKMLAKSQGDVRIRLQDHEQDADEDDDDFDEEIDEDVHSRANVKHNSDQIRLRHDTNKKRKKGKGKKGGEA